MPLLDGFAATAALRRRESGGPRTPVIAMTAHAMDHDRQRYLDGGMDDYVAKPMRLEELEAALRRWVLRAPAEPAAEPRDDGTAPAAEPGPAIIDESAWGRLRRLQQPGQPDVLAKYLGVFLEVTPRRLLDLREALARGALDDARGIAHTLRGEAEVVGAREMQALGARLEHLNGDGSLTEAQHLVTELEEAFARARAALAGGAVRCES
jgi:CheY-like chemotaxis protein